MNNKTCHFLLLVSHPSILTELRRRLPQMQRQSPDSQDTRFYFELTLPSVFPDGTRIEYQLAIAAPLSFSRAAAASLATSAIQRFRPRYVLSLGIAWANHDKVRRDDVLIAEAVIDSAATNTAIYQSSLLGHGSAYPADARLLTAARNLGIAQVVHVGPMVSTESALAARPSEIARPSGQPLAIDLLSAGVARAAHESAQRPGVLVACSPVSEPAALGDPDFDVGTGLVDWTLDLLGRGPIPISEALDSELGWQETIDFRAERGQHDHFVAREEILSELDRHVEEATTDRGWLLITGTPGVGKSALLANWLKQRDLRGVLTPCHFIRRGVADWADPQVIQSSLCGQLLRGFPQLQQMAASLRRSRDGLLAQLLSTLSENVLRPGGRRLVLCIDGLDEAQVANSHENPLPRFLPSALPHGVFVVCTSRPTHPHLSWLEARLDPVHRIALDSAHFQASNERACVALWQSYAPEFSPPLSPEFIAEAVRRAEGNLLHVVKLREWLLEQPLDHRRADLVPIGLQGFLEQTWQALGGQPPAEQTLCFVGLGLLCAARAELSLGTLSRAAGWSVLQEGERFLRLVRPLLRCVQGGPTEPLRFAPFHGSFREFILRKLGPDAIQSRHRELAQGLAMWPPSATLTMEERHYALRFALSHRLDGSLWQDASALVHDIGFLTALCAGPGAHAAEEQLHLVAENAPLPELAEDVYAIERALRSESHHLWRHPESLPELLYNRLRCEGFSTERLARKLCWPHGLPPIRLRHPLPERRDDSVRTLAGHTQAVYACAITPDGTRALSASMDGTLRLWELDSGHELRVLLGHSAAVTSCVITPDGHTALSVSSDGTLRRWNLADGLQRSVHELSCGQLAACSLSADGNRLAIVSNSGVIVLWDVALETQLCTMRHEHQSWLACIALSPDGRRIASGDMDGRVKVFNTNTQRELASLDGHRGAIRALTISADGQRLLSASHDQTLVIWDLRTGQPLRTLEGHESWVCGAAIDAQHMVSGAQDRTVRLWDLEKGEPLAIFRGHALGILACALTPDGRFAVTGSADNTLKIWNLQKQPETRAHLGHDRRVTCCAISPDELRAISGGIDGTLRIWDLSTGDELAVIDAHDHTIFSCLITPDGLRAVTAGRDRTVKVWSLATGDKLATLEGHRAEVRACLLSKDGTQVISGSSDGTVRVWDLATFQQLEVVRAHKTGIHALGQSADGRLLMTGGADHTIGVWDWERRELLYTLHGDEDSIWSLAVSADGRRLYSADPGGWRPAAQHGVRVWDLVKGQELTSFIWHTDLIDGCALSCDGKWLLTCSDDHTLTVTEVDRLRPQLSVYGRGPFSCLAVGRGVMCAGDSLGNLWMLELDGELRDRETRRVVGPGADILALLRGRRDRDHRRARDETIVLLEKIHAALAQEKWDEVLALIAELALPHLVESELQALLDPLWQIAEYFQKHARTEDGSPSASENLACTLQSYALFINVADGMAEPPSVRIGQALMHKYFCHLFLRQEQEANACLQEVLRRFEDSPDRELQQLVAMVFTSRAQLADARGRDTDQHWFELARRFVRSPTKELRQLGLCGLILCCDALAKKQRWATVVELTEAGLSLPFDASELGSRWGDLMHSQAVARAELGDKLRAQAIFDAVIQRARSLQVGDEPAVRPELVPMAMQNRAKLLLQSKKSAEAEAIQQAIVAEYAESSDDTTRLMVGEARFQQAMSKIQQGEWEEGATRLQDLASDLRGSADESLHELALNARYNAAVALREHGEIQRAARIFRAIGRGLKSPHVRQQQLAASSLYNLGVLLHDEERLRSACRAYDAVIDSFGTHPDSKIRELVQWALNNKRQALHAMGQEAQAHAVTDQQISHAAEVLSPDAFKTQVQYQFQRAIDLQQAGRYREAIEVCDALIEKYQKGRTVLEQGVSARAMVQKGYVLAQLGQKQDAFQLWQEVVRRFDEAEDPDLLERALLAKLNQAGVYLSEQKDVEAELLLQDVRRRSDGRTEQHFQHLFAQATNNLANVHGRRGSYAKACELQTMVEQRFSAVHDPQVQEEVAIAEINHAQLVLAEGGTREAIPLLFDACQRCKRYDLPAMQRLGRMAQKQLDALLSAEE